MQLGLRLIEPTTLANNFRTDGQRNKSASVYSLVNGAKSSKHFYLPLLNKPDETSRNVFLFGTVLFSFTPFLNVRDEVQFLPLNSRLNTHSPHHRLASAASTGAFDNMVCS